MEKVRFILFSILFFYKCLLKSIFRLVHSEFFDAVISLVFPVLCVLFISYTFGFSHLIDVKKMLDFSMVFDFGL